MTILETKMGKIGLIEERESNIYNFIPKNITKVLSYNDKREISGEDKRKIKSYLESQGYQNIKFRGDLIV